MPDDPTPPDPSRPRAARHLAVLLLGAVLAGCGPGSGGSGIASGVAAGPPPAPSASPEAPPEAPSPAGCAVPADASTSPYAGTVRALQADCLLVGERWIDLGDAIIVRRSGGAATAADLVPGLPVTIEPRADDAGRALRVTIEDAG